MFKQFFSSIIGVIKGFGYVLKNSKLGKVSRPIWSAIKVGSIALMGYNVGTIQRDATILDECNPSIKDVVLHIFKSTPNWLKSFLKGSLESVALCHIFIPATIILGMIGKFIYKMIVRVFNWIKSKIIKKKFAETNNEELITLEDLAVNMG